MVYVIPLELLIDNETIKMQHDFSSLESLLQPQLNSSSILLGATFQIKQISSAHAELICFYSIMFLINDKKP